MPSVFPLMFSLAVLMGSCLPLGASVEFICPVTKPAVLNFEPNGSFTGHAANLYGDKQLFTVFPGNWKYTQREEQHGYRIPKIVWGSNVFDLSSEPGESPLRITGRRLDADSGSLEFHGAHTAWTNAGYFITSEFYVPTLGCWEVTGHLYGADLKVVIDLK